MGKLQSFFKLSEKGSNVKTEILAGFTTFMTMAYVLVVQPSAIIGFGDAASFTDVNGLVITKEALAVTCAIVSALITLFMGLYANMPFALATGMGTNFMFGALLQAGTLAFGEIMAITLISGTIFVVLTIFGIRDLIVKAIPKNIKVSIGAAIGFYIAYLGFDNSGIGVFEDGISRGDFTQPAVALSLLGLFLIAILTAYHVNGAILIGIVVVLVLSASMSTLSSLVLTSSSTLTLDLLKDNVMKNMTEKKQIITMQALIVFFIVISVVIALDPPVFIAQLMGISWGALAGAFLAPFLYGLYWKGVTRAGVWAGFIAGVGLTLSNMFIGYIESPINAGAAAMVAGLIVVPVVSLITPKLKKEKVQEVFECYEEKVTITKKHSLQE